MKMEEETDSPEKMMPADVVRKEGDKLDKITLNNTIVKLRPLVVQARVHSIHHLSALIKARERKNIYDCARTFLQ